MARRVLLSVVIIVVASLGLAACGDDEVSLDPPEIRYGEDISEMGMFVTDPRFTAATLPEDQNEWLLFDDIGELLRYRDGHPDTGFQAMWVNDYHDEEWLKAEDAWYVETTELNTPMGWGIAALRDETAARALADDLGGEAMSWDDIDAREWTAPPAPDDHATHGATPIASPVATPSLDDAATPAATPDHTGH